jgi:hypothetical protein
MLPPLLLCFLCIFITATRAQSSGSQILLSGSSLTGQITGSSEATSPTGSYTSYASTITASTTPGILGSIPNGATILGTGNVTSYISVSSQIILQGSSTATVNGTNAIGTTTSSSVQPTNTTPCNNYPEFCSRQYSNITEVSAHNSPFDIANNIASNQHYPVTTQLNDGIRLLQAQMHFVNGTPHFCHTSCSLLDAGPITIWLTEVYQWVSTHPYDVVTIILENGDYQPVTSYVPFIESTGLTKYTYIPPKIPMALSDWPTLETMILTGKRVVLFMDYDADQSTVPWILDEFSQLWETPFDQTNRSFPCNPQRPPNLSNQQTTSRMYMTNHNLNYEIDLLGNAVLVPYIPLLDVTNNVTGNGSLGAGVQECVDLWNFPPKFLDVDFYDVGNGSVFEVAAKWNGVVYNRTCCGLVTKSWGEWTRKPADVRWLISAAVLVASLVMI